MGFYSDQYKKDEEKSDKGSTDDYYSKKLNPEVVEPNTFPPVDTSISENPVQNILPSSPIPQNLPESMPKIEQNATIVNGEFVTTPPPENPGTEVPQLEIPNDPNTELKNINEGSGSDSEKIIKIKKLYPNAVVTRSKKGAVLHVQGKKIPILKPGTENLPELNTPEVRVLDGQKVGGIVVSDDTARRSKTTYAETMDGKQNIMNSYVKEALGSKADPLKYVQMTTDSYGNTVINIKKDFGTKNWKYKKGRYYENNFERVDAGVNKYGPMVAASIATSGIGYLSSMLSVGLTAGTSEAKDQYLNEQAGIEPFSWQRVGVTAGLAAIGEGAGRAVMAGVAKYFANKSAVSKRFDSDGSLTPAYRQELVDSGVPEAALTPKFVSTLKKEINPEAGPAQVGRQTEASEMDIKLTPGQATREHRAMQQESELVKNNDAGAQLRAQLDAQDTQLFANLDKAGKGTKGEADAFVTGANAKAALKTDEEIKRKAASAEYNKGKKSAGNDAEVSREDFTAKMREVIDDWSEEIPPAVVGRLTALMNDTKPITLATTEKLIKLINKHRKTAIKGDSKWSSLSDVREVIYGLQKNMPKISEKAVGHFDKGRKLVSSRKEEYNAKNIVEQINRGKVSDEQVLDTMLRSNVSRDDFGITIKLLRRTEQGRKSINDMKASIVKKLKDKATVDQGADDVSFSAKKYVKELNSLINSKKMQLLFSQKEITYLTKLGRVANMRNFPNIVYNRSGTASALINYLQNNAISGWVKAIASPILAPIKEQIAINAGKKTLSSKAMKQATKRAAKSSNKPSKSKGVKNKFKNYLMNLKPSKAGGGAVGLNILNNKDKQ